MMYIGTEQKSLKQLIKKDFNLVSLCFYKGWSKTSPEKVRVEMFEKIIFKHNIPDEKDLLFYNSEMQNYTGKICDLLSQELNDHFSSMKKDNSKIHNWFYKVIHLLSGNKEKIKNFTRNDIELVSKKLDLSEKISIPENFEELKNIKKIYLTEKKVQSDILECDIIKTEVTLGENMYGRYEYVKMLFHCKDILSGKEMKILCNFDDFSRIFELSDQENSYNVFIGEKDIEKYSSDQNEVVK